MEIDNTSSLTLRTTHVAQHLSCKMYRDSNSLKEKHLMSDDCWSKSEHRTITVPDRRNNK